MLLLCLILVAVVIVLMLLCYRCSSSPYNVFTTMGVPGPAPIPVFGNYIQFMRKEEIKMYEELRDMYGPVCGIYFGKTPFLLISDHDILQHILVSDFNFFPDRINAPLLNSRMAGLPLGIFETCSHKWLPMRRLLSPLFTSMKTKQIAPTFEESCQTLVVKMKSESESKNSVDVQSLYDKFVLETTILVILGQRVSVLNGEGKEFKEAVHTAIQLSQGNFFLGSAILNLPTQFLIESTVPCVTAVLRWLGPGKFMNLFKVVEKTIVNLITNHKKKEQPFSMLDALMSCYGNGSNSLAQDEVISHIVNAFTAACDTTALTLTSCSHVLATHSHIQEKLCTLLDQYWENNPGASVSTVAQNIPYLDMFVDETLRMFPPSPRTVRRCTQTTIVNGLEIPKGINIIIPILLLHNMEEVWEDPHIFCPERFETEERSTQPPCSFLPFGQGPRNCIGIRVAKLEVKMALVALLQQHRFVPTIDTYKPLKIKCTTMTSYFRSKVFVSLESRQLDQP